MISKEDIEKVLNSYKVQSELSVNDDKTVEILKIILRLSHIEEVIDITHEFLTEVSNQVGQTSGYILKDTISEVLSDTLEEFGWLDDNETVTEEIYNKKKKK